MLARWRRLRPLVSGAGVAIASSSFRQADDTLAPSPILVGGVEEEDCALELLSTVMTLRTESAESARLILGAVGREVVAIASPSSNGMAISVIVALHVLKECCCSGTRSRDVHGNCRLG